jgi:murein DD-endopeptidase MepM/ murein hydrolase activator NlpD
MKNKNSQKIFLNSEKNESLAFFNLIFLILIIFSFSIFSMFDSKNEIYQKKKLNKYNNLQNSINGSYKEINVNFLNHKSQNNSPDSAKILKEKLISEKHFLISDKFGNVIVRLKEEFFFDDSKIKELISFATKFKNSEGNLFSSETFGSLDKSRNLIELRIKIDDFRFLRINKNLNKRKESDSEFEIKKVFRKTYISDLKEIDDGEQGEFGQNFSTENNKNFLNSDLTELIGFNSNNQNLFFVEKNIANQNDLKNLLVDLKLSKENINPLLGSASSSFSKNKNLKSKSDQKNSHVSFKALIAFESQEKNNSQLLKKISYEKNSKSPKKELIYFSLDNKSYYLYKKNGVKAYYDSEGKSLHLKRMFSMPLSGAYRISSNFGMRFHPVLHYKRMHNGVDLAIKHGHPVNAPADGIVQFAARKGGYGNYLIINHGGGYKTGYAHLSRFEKKIQPGKFVSRGQLVAYVGNTGTSSGPHLHYEIIKNNKFVDPFANNPKVSEKLDKNEIKKFNKLAQLINAKILQQKKEREYESVMIERLNKKIDKI